MKQSTSKAKFYIYRNLTKGGFSVRYKGRVVAHHDNILAIDATTKVNQATRARVLRLKTKYVHAFIVCDTYLALDNKRAELHKHDHGLNGVYELYYNPYKQNHFSNDMYGDVSQRKFGSLLLTNGKVYC